MAVGVVMPRLSDSMEEAAVLEWLVAEGDEVKRGQALAEIETDKATVTYEAEDDGVLLRIVVGAGETAALGQPIAVIGAAGEEAGEPMVAAGPAAASPASPA